VQRLLERATFNESAARPAHTRTVRCRKSHYPRAVRQAHDAANGISGCRLRQSRRCDSQRNSAARNPPTFLKNLRTVRALPMRSQWAPVSVFDCDGRCGASDAVPARGRESRGRRARPQPARRRPCRMEHERRFDLHMKLIGRGGGSCGVACVLRYTSRGPRSACAISATFAETRQ